MGCNENKFLSIISTAKTAIQVVKSEREFKKMKNQKQKSKLFYIPAKNIPAWPCLWKNTSFRRKDPNQYLK